MGEWLPALMLNSTLVMFVSLKKACTGTAKSLFVYSNRWERDSSTSAQAWYWRLILDFDEDLPQEWNINIPSAYNRDAWTTFVVGTADFFYRKLHWFFGLHSESFVMFIITWSAKIKAILDKFRELSYTILLLPQLLARDSQTLLL